MQCFGDPGMDLFRFAPEGKLYLIPMSTAIFRRYTPHGFIIAADSRNSNPLDHSVISNECQKIFCIRNCEGTFAMVFSGTVGITADEGEELVWDLCQEALKSAASLESRRTSTLHGMAVRICRPVNQLLREIKKDGRTSKYPDFEPFIVGDGGTTIARLFIDGYHRGIPARVNVRFWHETQRLMEPDIRHVDLYLGDIIYGSATIGDLLWRSEDPRFSALRLKPSGDPITDAIQTSESYIRACSIPEAAAIDERCYAIGGDPQIATITPAGGFQWVPGYEPASIRKSADPV
jgi:hypothetical protein